MRGASADSFGIGMHPAMTTTVVNLCAAPATNRRCQRKGDTVMFRTLPIGLAAALAG